jgi:hypothetical protein
MNFIENLLLMCFEPSCFDVICLICYRNHEMNHGSDVTNLDHNSSSCLSGFVFLEYAGELRIIILIEEETILQILLLQLLGIMDDWID